jgi:hypothetical protein
MAALLRDPRCDPNPNPHPPPPPPPQPEPEPEPRTLTRWDELAHDTVSHVVIMGGLIEAEDGARTLDNEP